MGRKNILLILALVIVVAVGGFFLYNALLGETEEASGPITAVPLTDEIGTTANDEAEAAVDVASGDSSGATLFSISQEGSEVTFTLSEVLRGQPTTVIGETDQVAGEIAVDLNDLSSAQVGTIQVNARTFVTDESRRNQMIRNQILDTDSYELITFTPTEISGLSGSTTPGQEWTFQITGDLTIRDITQPVTFDVTAQVDDDNRLLGTAVTTINRADFDLNIPSVPFVADVGEEVTLALNFMASEA